MTIRPLQRQDIPAAAAIVRMNYSEEYGDRAKREMRAMFGSAPIKPIFLVAEEEESAQIVGLICFMQDWMDYDIFKIFWVNVHPKHRNRRIGMHLVTEVLQRIRKIQEAQLILLTADGKKELDKYYNFFGFRSLQKFGRGYHLMSLVLNKN